MQRGGKIMWEQNMAIVEERRKQLEREAAHYRQVRDLRQHPHTLLTTTRAQVGKSLTAITGLLRNRPDTESKRLKVRQI